MSSKNKTVKASELWSKLDEKKQEGINGGQLFNPDGGGWWGSEMYCL